MSALQNTASPRHRHGFRVQSLCLIQLSAYTPQTLSLPLQRRFGRETVVWNAEDAFFVGIPAKDKLLLTQLLPLEVIMGAQLPVVRMTGPASSA